MAPKQNDPSPVTQSPDVESLEQRLASLTPAQRALLARRLANGHTAPSAASPVAMMKAQPLHQGQDAEGRTSAWYPASNGQQRMWFLHRYLPDSPVYNSPAAFRLHGPLHVAGLEAALHRVIQRQESLRTTFAMEKGTLMQCITIPSRFRLEQVEVPLSASEDRWALAEQWMGEAARTTFDLSTAPPFRGVLYSLSANEHLFLVVTHHIITDGWSFSNFSRDLSAMYSAVVTGASADLPDLHVHFRDYSAWQTRRLEGGALSTQAAYWKNKLAGELAPLELPLEGSRPASESFRGETCSLQIDQQLVTKLLDLALRQQATLFMVLLAAFKVLLHRYTGQTDLLVGVPVANRQKAEIEGVIGLFTNTLVMRTTVRGEESFEQLLQHVKDTALEAYEHQDMPLEQLVQFVDAQRKTSRAPLLYATFALQDFPEPNLILHGIEATAVPVSTHTAKFDLSLAVKPATTGLSANLEFSTDIISSARAHALLQHWHAVLKEVAAEPAQRIQQISLLSPEEKYCQLVQWNQTEHRYPSRRCIQELFAEQVACAPDAIAVCYERQLLTYRELDDRSTQLANELQRKGLGPGLLAGVCLERSQEMVVALLAVLKTGAAYVPLNPQFPARRLAFILEDAKVDLLLHQRSHAGLCPDFQGISLLLDEWMPREAPSQERTKFPDTSAAYVMYTSGSTGQPKGVVVEHRSVVNLFHSMKDLPGIAPRDVVLAVTPISFDISVVELLLPLCAGARVVIAPDEVRRDGAALAALLQASAATIFQTTPATWQMLVLAGWAGNPTLKALTGGDVLSPQLAKQLLVRCAELWNLYGPTETTVYSHGMRVNESEAITIGKPLANVVSYVVDGTGNLAPAGLPGELWIGGEGLARGYIGRPDLTRERFVANPFTANPEDRIYKSGDLVRCRPDGSIEFLGRVDSQVKIRGVRVELGEIEASLVAHAAVASCAVTVQDRGESKTLTAFVVPREGAELSAGALRLWLKQSLPDYMVPSRLVRVLALPLNASGKVDLKALKHLDEGELEEGTTTIAPQTARERELVEIWKAVLGREQIGTRDNFFDLGGHSILAVVLSLRIAEQMGVNVPLRSLLEHPTIEEIAQKVESFHQDARACDTLNRVHHAQPIPMSFGQRQMWLLQKTIADAATYNQPIAWRLSGAVDKERIRRALYSLQQRHGILRTALVSREEGLFQEVLPFHHAEVSWREVNVRQSAARDQESVLAALLLEEARIPFDLAIAPLWRTAWIALAEDDHVLAFTFHHSIMDEWSMQVFLRDLEVCYAKDAAHLPELPFQYADYSVWQTSQLTPSLLAQLRTYWASRLEHLPPRFELPNDLPRRPEFSNRGAVYEFEFPEVETVGPARGVTHRLRALARQEQTTLFTIVLAAFQIWLYRYTGQRDVVVATPIANRDRPEANAMLGYFLNTLPIRTKLDPAITFIEVVRQVRDSALNAFAHARLPFEQIVEVAGLADAESRSSQLSQVMFVLLEEDPRPIRLDHARSHRLTTETGTSKNELTLHVRASDRSMACRWQYATDLFTADRAETMSRHLAELFRAMADDPQKPISQLSLMPAVEREQILRDWNRTQTLYPRDQCIHEVFEEQVNHAPDAVAVTFRGQSLSYRDLHAQARLLSQKLRGLGVAEGSIVALCLERSLAMVAALLGILEAGGAYWALEEGLPDGRLQKMLADARPQVLIFQRDSGRPLPDCLRDGKQERPLLVAMEDLLAPEAVPLVSAGIPRAAVATATSPAYLCYTSGSTGEPKGVVVPHRGVLRLVKGTDYVHLGADETLLHQSPMSFDASTFELWGALLNGGRVLLLPPGLPTVSDLKEAIMEYQVTTLWLTASLFHLMVDAGLEDLPCLRQLLAGGDVLSPAKVSSALKALPGLRLINGYGPTENTTFTCCYTVTAQEEFTAGVPIGRPIANTQVYILDESCQPVPVGVAGELYVGGDGLAHGYLNQPQLTAEKFVADPFSILPGARLYRTGDLAQWRADGNVEFLGRVDAQVKIRGFRVELGEIEAALDALDDVREAAVAVSISPLGDRQIVAYLVCAPEKMLDGNILRARLAEKLPEYMLPSTFIRLDQLPMSANGKVDRKSLAALRNTEEAGVQKANPLTLLEFELQRIWMRLLQRNHIERTDNFFALGGHSLTAIRLAAAIEKLLGHKLAIASLFQSPTIESLARRLKDNAWMPAWSSLVPLQPHGSKPPLFFIHGTGGDVFGVLDLARALGPDQPSFGVQALGLDGAGRHERVETMAAHYVEEILSFQPHGTYHLAGYSLGGLLAYEVAQQLQGMGKKVSMLAILDSQPIAGTPKIFYGIAMASHFLRRSVGHVRSWWKLPRGERYQFVQSLWTTFRRMTLQNNAPELAARYGYRPGHEADHLGDYYFLTARAYRLQSYAGSIDVVFSDAAKFGFRWYWRHLAKGGASFHRVSGHHSEIIRSPQHVEILARTLTGILQRRQR